MDDNEWIEGWVNGWIDIRMDRWMGRHEWTGEV